MKTLRLALAAAATASVALTALPAAASTPHVAQLRPTLGNHAVCRPQRAGQICVTRTDNGTTGTRNRIFFRNGVRAYGGYWTLEKAGAGESKVGDNWPSRYHWFNAKWRGNTVVQIAGFTFGHQFAIGRCNGGVHISLCMEHKSGLTYWVEYATGGRGDRLWHFVSVKGTGDIYQLTGKRDSYVLTSNGVGRIAVITINGHYRAQSFKVPGV